MEHDDALRQPRPTWVLVLLLSVLTVAAYVAWLAWDSTYQTDPVTGAVSGPYEAWQVVGCALTLGVLALLAGMRRRPGVALAVVPLVFTVAWSVDAATTDESGLWLVGAVLVLAGSLAGVAAVAYPAAAWARRRQRTSRT